MNIDLKYPELRLIHSLVTARRQQMFKELLTGHPKVRKFKQISIDELSEMQKKYNEERNPFCEPGQCGIILDKIEEIEDKIRGALTYG